MGTIQLPCGKPLRRLNCPGSRGSKLIAHAKKQAKKNRRQQQEQPAGKAADASTTRILLETLEEGLPRAPPTSNRASRFREASPGDIYPVFAPQPGAASDAPWRWDDDGEDALGPEEGASSSDSGNEPDDVPRWNPRTGFMRTAAELRVETQAEGSAAEAAAAGTAGGSSVLQSLTEAAIITTSGASGASEASTSGRPPSPGGQTAGRPAAVDGSEPAADAAAGPSAAAPSQPAPLPPASRNSVLTSALGTGFWMAVLAVFFRNYAALNGATAMGTDPAAVSMLLEWPTGFESAAQAGVAVAAAAAVTASRLALTSVWPDLREATDRSNRQVLTNLGPLDILLVALVSGVPEELLFRGALVPATFPDWRGVAIAAAIFGALHNSGGRNPAFAAWATTVGGVYGAAFLCTGNVWVPAAAHVAANAASAFVWKARVAAEAAGAKEAREAAAAARGRAVAVADARGKLGGDPDDGSRG